MDFKKNNRLMIERQDIQCNGKEGVKKDGEKKRMEKNGKPRVL